MDIQALKALIKRPCLRVFLLVFFLCFSIFLVKNNNVGKNNEAVGKLSKIVSGMPRRLIIPAIKVDAGIQSVGITAKREMEVPDNAIDVGWFELGPRPGEIGSAVVVGHFDGKNGEEGVFFNLNELQQGDKVYIEDDKGILIEFVVRESRIYDPGLADDVLKGSDSAQLNLITCDGVWDGTKKSYSKRLVVFADKFILDK